MTNESDINSTQNQEKNSKNDNSINNIETKGSKKSQPVKLKRRPSINDLFGDDSEDEDDHDEVNELKQLVAQQGGINVHFPIKMPIVLKTNFLSDKNKSFNNNDDDDIPLSKKWVPIYPEMNETSKNSGSKWKAIGANSESEQKSTSKTNAKVYTDNDKKNEKSNNNNHHQKMDIKKHVISSKLQSSLRKVKDEENQDIFPDIESVRIKKPASKTKDETPTKTTKKQQDNEKISHKNSTSSDNKIRTCKHGRPLAHKNKESSSSSSTSTAKQRAAVETTTSRSVHQKDHSSRKRERSDPILDHNQDDRYDHHRKFSRNEHSKLESKAVICPPPSSSNVKITQSSSKTNNNNDNRLRDSTSKDEINSNAKNHRHHHHHHHRRHHHRHKHDSENNSSGANSGHRLVEEKKYSEKKSNSKSNMFQSYPKIDSKEIFAQGLYGSCKFFLLLI